MYVVCWQFWVVYMSTYKLVLTLMYTPVRFWVNVYMSTYTVSTSTFLSVDFVNTDVDIDVVDLVNDESTLIQKLFRKQAP